MRRSRSDWICSISVSAQLSIALTSPSARTRSSFASDFSRARTTSRCAFRRRSLSSAIRVRSAAAAACMTRARSARKAALSSSVAFVCGSSVAAAASSSSLPEAGSLPFVPQELAGSCSPSVIAGWNSDSLSRICLDLFPRWVPDRTSGDARGQQVRARHIPDSGISRAEIASPGPRRGRRPPRVRRGHSVPPR